MIFYCEMSGSPLCDVVDLLQNFAELFAWQLQPYTQKEPEEYRCLRLFFRVAFPQAKEDFALRFGLVLRAGHKDLR